MKKLLLFFLLIALYSPTWGQLPESIKMDFSKKGGFYDLNQIRELRLTFDQSNWADQLDSLRLLGKGLLGASLQIEDWTNPIVGVRYRGNKSFQTGSPRNSLHIKLDYKIYNCSVDGHRSLKLSNALRDPSMIREVLGFEIARNYMPAPQANFVKLYINDTYQGLFINVEPIDEVFLEENFQSSDQTLVKAGSDLQSDPPADCKNKIFAALEYENNTDCYAHNFELKSGKWQEVQALTKQLQSGGEELEAILKVDQALWMLAFNNVLVNLNSYTGQHSQNYYLYRDQFGQFSPILWDLNLAFGSYKNTGRGSDLDLAGLQEMDPLLHADNPRKPLIAKLLANPLYRKAYLSHIRTIVYDQFVSGRYADRARELQGLIKAAFINDPHKYYELSDFENSLDQTIGRRSKIPGIMELMEPRASFLKKHPEIAVIPPEVSEVHVIQREKFAADTIQHFRIQAKVDKLPKRVKVYYRFSPEEAYQEVYMADNGQSNDKKAGDKVFGVKISPPKGIRDLEYFILTENARAVSFYPVQYMKAPLQVTLMQLN